ncbi:MAG: hypothetical protein WCH99_10110 [Verrucomicrobiota bacterium]
MIFAEAIASNINWTLICTILMAIGTFGMWLDARKAKSTVIEPNPLPVQKIWPAATTAEMRERFDETNRRLAAHDKDLAELREVLRKELPEMERRIAMSGEGRVEKIHGRINEVLAEVSKLEGMIERDFQS